MSLAMFQRALVELTLTPVKARALRDGDPAVLAGFDLTELERERLAGVVRQPGISVSCSLSRGNRFEMIFQALPMTCVLLKPILRALVDELWEYSRPSNYQLAGEETAFVELLKNKIAAGKLPIPYLEEIFSYELACLEIVRQARGTSASHDDVIVNFQHSPEALLPPLSQLQPPPAGLPVSPCRARVVWKEERFEVEILHQDDKTPSSCISRLPRSVWMNKTGNA